MTPMIDLHCHILPELDDGAQSLQEALEMVHIAVQSGVKRLVATPHCSHDQRSEVQRSYRLLRDAVKELKMPLELYLGMEIYGRADTAKLLRDGKLLTLNGSRYPLVEFDFLSSGEEETWILKELIQTGYRPLVAHPERYLYLQQEPELINEWHRMGCLFQINRGSLLGRFGGNAQELALAMIDRGFATAVASDAHSASRRTPWMQDIQIRLNRDFSPETGKFLLRHYPKMIIENRELPHWEPEWF